MGSTGRRLVAMTATACVVLSPLAFTASPASADPRDEAVIHVVSPATMADEQWMADAYEGTDDGEYVDPNQSSALAAGAPLGRGARFFQMGAFSVQTELYRTTALDGERLDDISRLDYSTWQVATGSRSGTPRTDKQPVYLRLSLSEAGGGGQTATLNFEPASNATQGAVAQDTWQDWNTVGGTWHVVQSPTWNGPEFTTLADYLDANPDATLANGTNGGALSIVGGSSGANQTYAKLGFDRIAAEVGDQSYLWDLEPSGAGASAVTSVVKTLDGGWNGSAYNYSGNGGAGSTTDVRQSFVIGPKVPPRGDGSLQLEIGDNSDSVQFLRSTVLDGQPVDDLRQLAYSTYAAHKGGNGSALQQPVYLRLSISSDGSGAKDTTLNFEPANNPDQGAVADATWQRWNAFQGRFRVVEGPGETLGSLITLPAYMTRHADATLATNPRFGGQGALSFLIGAAGDNQRNGRFAVDLVSVGLSRTVSGVPGTAVTNYDLEPTYTTPSVRSTQRTGAGPVTLTGTAGPGDEVEIRTLTGTGDWDTLAGTATADDSGAWTFALPDVRERTQVRAWLAGTYGTTDIHSATAKVDVKFRVTLTTQISGAYAYGSVKLNPAVGGVQITWQHYVDRKWTTVYQNNTAASGAAAYRWKTTKGTTYTVRAVATGTSTVLGGNSATSRVTAP
jgi:hypothetical protein